jgi:hypothetical protein
MKQASKLHFFIWIFLLFFTWSCIERIEYPKEPFIEYQTFYIVKGAAPAQDVGNIVIEFTDGDGDLGLSPADTLYPFHPEGDYYYNFMMDIFQPQGNDTIRIPYNMRFPSVNPDDYPQNLKGEIVLQVPLNELRVVRPDNLFQFELFIFDRALNKSNVIRSPIIPI